MMIVIAILLTLMLSVSLYVNRTFYIHLKDFETRRENDDNVTYDELERLRKFLDEKAQIVKNVATADVASDDPYVKRVIAAIVDARFALEQVRDRVGELFDGNDVEK